MKSHVKPIIKITVVSFGVLLLLAIVFFSKLNFIPLGTQIVEIVSGTEVSSGTYTGKGRGGHSLIEVEVIVDDQQRINSINILNHNETPDIAAPAFDEIPRKIIEDNSTDVEVVSGATLTSEGIIEAVNGALGK